jgi:hypothetical protein
MHSLKHNINPQTLPRIKIILEQVHVILMQIQLILLDHAKHPLSLLSPSQVLVKLELRRPVFSRGYTDRVDLDVFSSEL